MYSIGIVGAGLAGLHLALCLQYLNIPATLYTDRSSVAMRVMPLTPLTVRLAQVRRRERALGVEHWSPAEVGLYGGHLHLTGGSPWSVYGALDAPASVIDPRLYGATLLEDFQARGGDVQVQPTLTPAYLAHLSDSHSLMVVTDGRPSLIDRLFASLSDQTPFDIPQRIVSLGLFHGLDFPLPAGFAVHVHPTQGEIVQLPCLTFDGLTSALLFEGRPGSEIAGLRYLRYTDDPRAFNSAVLAMLRRYAPLLYERVHLADFGLTRPLDLFQGGVAPSVRRGWASLGNGKYAQAAS